MSRKCSICTNASTGAVNTLVADGISFRVISRQLLGDEKHHDSIRRHAENCLKLEIQALIKAKRLNQAVNHYEEICEQLLFAKELRTAARAFLSDPETNQIALLPRADEVTVIYEDYSDTNSRGEPKRKKDSLSNLLTHVAAAVNIKGVQAIIKHVDIRSFALDAIRTADVVLDKIAKLEGLYTKERENQDKLANTVRAVVDWLTDYPQQRERLDDVIRDFSRGRVVDADELREKVLEQLDGIH
jgi:hypothetical protein